MMAKALAAFERWREVPAPQRGEVVRQLGEELRRAQGGAGRAHRFEAGKIRSEGLGEVQEMIDIADFAVGLSRQLYGLTMHSERPGHRMYEQWHPLGLVGRDHRVQFPGRGVGLERDARRRVRRPVVWKPSLEDAAHRGRGADASATG